MLTALAIEKLKPKEKQYKVSDGNSLSSARRAGRGQSSGDFATHSAAKKNCCRFGSFPDVSLAAARGKRDEALAAACKRHQSVRSEKARQARCRSCRKKHVRRNRGRVSATAGRTSGVTQITLSKNRWLLLDLASPLAKRPIAKITPLEILVLLQKHEKAGRRETAKRLARHHRGSVPPGYRHAAGNHRPDIRAARCACCPCCDAPTSYYR